MGFLRGKKPAMKRQVSGAQRGTEQLFFCCQHKMRYYEVREIERQEVSRKGRTEDGREEHKWSGTVREGIQGRGKGLSKL